MELREMFDYIGSLLRKIAFRTEDTDEIEFGLTKLRLISQARVALDIIEGQIVHELRNTLPQTSFGAIGDAQGISKQASRIRHSKLEQVLKVHQLDGHRHAMSKAVVSAKHRRAATPARRARKAAGPPG